MNKFVGPYRSWPSRHHGYHTNNALCLNNCLSFIDPYIQYHKISDPHQSMPKNEVQLQQLYGRIVYQSPNNKQQAQRLKATSKKPKNQTKQYPSQDKQQENESISMLEETSLIASLQSTHNYSLKSKLSVIERYSDYRMDVSRIWEAKGKNERDDFPPISFQHYQEIRDIWMEKGTLVSQKIPGCSHLRIEDLQHLKYGRCLNDEVISEYICMLRKAITADRSCGSFRIIDSLQVASYFDKSKYEYQKTLKFIQKQINSEEAGKEKFVLVIHSNNHWLFVHAGKRALEIYDSLAFDSTSSYTKHSLFSNIHSFFCNFYQRRLPIKICTSFPQQKNGYDCGVLMLCGIRDYVRGFITWGFNVQETVYKRILMMKEILEHRLQGFKQN